MEWTKFRFLFEPLKLRVRVLGFLIFTYRITLQEKDEPRSLIHTESVFSRSSNSNHFNWILIFPFDEGPKSHLRFQLSFNLRSLGPSVRRKRDCTGVTVPVNVVNGRVTEKTDRLSAHTSSVPLTEREKQQVSGDT